MTDAYRLRLGTIDEAAIISEHRRKMFEELDYSAEICQQLGTHFEPWVRERMTNERYFAWFAVDSTDQVVAGAGLWIIDWPPDTHDPLGARDRGHIVNVYTEPAHRHKGLARRLMEATLQTCRVHQIWVVTLNASVFGRPLYDQLGFIETHQMQLVLSQTNL